MAHVIIICILLFQLSVIENKETEDLAAKYSPIIYFNSRKFSTVVFAANGGPIISRPLFMSKQCRCRHRCRNI